MNRVYSGLQACGSSFLRALPSLLCWLHSLTIFFSLSKLLFSQPGYSLFIPLPQSSENFDLVIPPAGCVEAWAVARSQSTGRSSSAGTLRTFL